MDNALAKIGVKFPNGAVYTVSEDGKTLTIAFVTGSIGDADVWVGYCRLGELKEKHGISETNWKLTRIHDTCYETVITIHFT